jgi:hypothetical protein
MTKIGGSGSESRSIIQMHAFPDSIRIHTKMSWIRNTGRKYIAWHLSPGEPPGHAQVPDAPDVAAEATALAGAPHARLHGGGELRVLPTRPLPLHHLRGVTLQAHDRLDHQLSSTHEFISFFVVVGWGGDRLYTTNVRLIS